MPEHESLIKFTAEELARFKTGLKTCCSFPFIDGIEDYILEAVFEYAREIEGIDPFIAVRSKALYDVVDTNARIGWSVKSIQVASSFTPGSEFELVIQRADIFKKAQELGFGELNEDSDTQLLGAALLKHWSDKVEADALAQRIDEKRVFILLKLKGSAFHRNFYVYEAPLMLHSPDEIVWRWSDGSKLGLQGLHRETGRCLYRWYKGQKQFFERFVLPQGADKVSIDVRRLTKREAVDMVDSFLQAQP